MPKLWTDTIEAHRSTVREAILDAAWRLVSEHGLLSVTMSQIAEATGIGRATLYKYFPDVESIVVAQHERHVAAHLEQLAKQRDRRGDPASRLEAVMEQYALICHRRRHHGTEELAALVHQPERIAHAQRQLIDLFAHMLTEVAAAGGVRDDIAPDELASYCLHALSAAGGLPSEAAVRRLVAITLAGLRPQH